MTLTDKTFQLSIQKSDEMTMSKPDSVLSSFETLLNESFPIDISLKLLDDTNSLLKNDIRLLVEDISSGTTFCITESESSFDLKSALIVIGDPQLLKSVDAEIIMDSILSGVHHIEVHWCIVTGDIWTPPDSRSMAIPCVINCTRTRFDGSLVLKSMIFLKQVILTQCLFMDFVSFEESNFQSKVFFTQSVFSEHARTSFCKTRFESDTYFGMTKFQNDVDFRSAHFLGECSFDHTNFDYQSPYQSYARFEEVTFDGKTVFSFTRFSSSPRFCRAQFIGLIKFQCVKMPYPADFRDVQFWPDTLGHSLICHLPQCILKIGWKTNGEPRAITRHCQSSYRPAGFPKAAGEFHIDSNLIDEVTNPTFKRFVADSQFIHDFRKHHLFVSFIWRWSSDYGRSMLLWFLCSVIIIFLFGAIYSGIPCPNIISDTPLGDILLKMCPDISVFNSIDNEFAPYYFSVVTFTTLGFGDVLPMNFAGQMWILIEVIIGYMMLGGLISIFSNKLARRS